LELKNVTADQLRDFVAKLCDEEEYEPVEGRWMFKSGGDCGRCTDAAMKVALAFGGRVVGYESSDNPSARIGFTCCEGHDFAIVANRFVVDYWAFRVARMVNTPVFDLRKHGDHELVRLLYGHEQSWKNVPVLVAVGFPQ
jgi:hypothetical protein